MERCTPSDYAYLVVMSSPGPPPLLKHTPQEPCTTCLAGPNDVPFPRCIPRSSGRDQCTMTGLVGCWTRCTTSGRSFEVIWLPRLHGTMRSTCIVCMLAPEP